MNPDNSETIAININKEIGKELNQKIKGKTSFLKFSADDWKRIEVKCDPFTKHVYDILMNLVDNQTIEKLDTKLIGCGNTIYNDEIRPNLQSNDILSVKLPVKLPITEKQENKENKKNKKNKKKSMSKKEIIEQQRVEKIKNNLIEVFNIFNKTGESILAYRSKIVEIKLIGLMKQISNLLNLDRINISEKKKEAFELICGTNKAIESARTFDNVSEQAVEDIIYLNKLLIKKVEFSIKTMLTKIPRLSLSTEYDFLFPKTSVSPYPSQKELVNKVMTNKEALIFFISMIGTGKTTMIAPLAKYIEKQQIKSNVNNLNIKHELLFACSVEPVRHQVALLAYNCSIKFGIASSNTKKFRVINHFSTTNENRQLVIADLSMALELLKNAKQNNTCYTLFIDEPTVGADQPNHPISRLVVQLLEEAPGMTILSSATMPRANEIPDLVKIYQTNHPHGKIEEVLSLESKIGCQVFTEQRTTIAPHVNCMNKEQLKVQIEKIESMPFLRRIYTPLMMYHLYDKMINNGIKKEMLPNLEEIFIKPSNLSQGNIEKIGIELLDILYKYGTDKSIKNITMLEDVQVEDFEKEQDIENDDNNESDEDIFETENVEEEEIKESIDLNRIFTKQSHYYIGGCLIACEDPVNFALDKASKLLDILNSDKIGGLKKFVKDYDNKVQEYDNNLNKFNQRHNVKDEDFQKSDKNSAAYGFHDGTRIKIKTSSGKKRNNEFEKNTKINDMKEQEGIIKPSFKFPYQFQINTLPFLKLFSPNKLKKIERSTIRTPFIDCEYDLGVSDDITLLLLCGIGIYTHNTTALTDLYLEKVLAYAEEGSLAFLISDDSICYGANYPFGHVIVEDSFALKHSIGTMFQLWGRAGRMGKSWSAHAHFTGKLSEKKFLEYLKGKIDKGTKMEADNLTQVYHNITKDRKSIRKVLTKKHEEKVRLTEITKKSAEKLEGMSTDSIKHKVISKSEKQLEKERRNEELLTKIKKNTKGKLYKQENNTGNQFAVMRKSKAELIKEEIHEDAKYNNNNNNNNNNNSNNKSSSWRSNFKSNDKDTNYKPQSNWRKKGPNIDIASIFNLNKNKYIPPDAK